MFEIIPSNIPIVAAILQAITANTQIIAYTTFWAALAACAAWYFTRTEQYFPLKTDEAKQLWTIHKLNTRCTSKKWKKITYEKQTIGIQCQCGYTHMQTKPLAAHSPMLLDTTRASAYNRLHTTYKSR